jgi:prepilin-type N-terminal cleavage/methylation domain-containing protein
MQTFNKEKGFTIIEVLIGSAIILIGILALITAYTTYVQYALSNEKNTQMVYLQEEAIETMGFLRDSGWTKNIKNLSTTTTYYLIWSSNSWATTTTMQYVDSTFLRQITLSDVFRDSNDKIANSGTYDSDTKKITVTVSYGGGKGTTTKSLSSYLANLYSN